MILTRALSIGCLLLAVSPVFAQEPTRAELKNKLLAQRRAIAATEAQLLAPAPADLEAFGSFLKLPNTGLFRLLPREVYDTGEFMTTRGGGAYFSFTERRHEYGLGSDIELSNKTLSVGFAGTDYGFITAIADTPIASMTIDHPSARFLASLQVPTVEPDARTEQRRAGAGVDVDGVRYARRVPATVGTTYLLRSVSYDASDVLVCLQAIRLDEDGSMVFAWKMLKEFPVPKLDRMVVEQE